MNTPSGEYECKRDRRLLWHTISSKVVTLWKDKKKLKKGYAVNLEWGILQCNHGFWDNFKHCGSLKAICWARNRIHNLCLRETWWSSLRFRHIHYWCENRTLPPLPFSMNFSPMQMLHLYPFKIKSQLIQTLEEKDFHWLSYSFEILLSYKSQMDQWIRMVQWYKSVCF